MAIPLRSPAEIEEMARAGRVLRSVLNAVQLSPGQTTLDVGDRVQRAIADLGAVPLLERQANSAAVMFGHAACVSVNEEVVHAPPRRRILRTGDVVTLDVAIQFPAGGWCVDAAISQVVGIPSSSRAKLLVQAADQLTDFVLAECACGTTWPSIAQRARSFARELGCHIASGYSGHGIGRSLHEPPRLDFSQTDALDLRLRPGMVFTIEPVVVEGVDPVELVNLDDGWTVVSRDRRWSAHREITVALTRQGPRVIT